ncbi:MAG: TIR domain-containing protein, partial [Nannocystaceae bacterium]
MADERAKITWVHLSDMHLSRQDVRNTRMRRFGGELWAHGLRAFFGDLEQQLDALELLPDLLLVTGDLTFSGREQQYRDLDEDLLDPLRERLAKRGGEPLLVAVPGNHDVQRPMTARERLPYRWLRQYDEQGDPELEELRSDLWRARDPAGIQPLFSDYARWSRRTMLPALGDNAPRDTGLRVVSHRVSHMPGDLSVEVEKHGQSLLLVGLNSAWVQYDGGEFEGKLHLPAAQLHAALADEDHAALQRFAQVDDALLLTHHPRSWLSPAAQEAFDRTVYPANQQQFAATLCGHLHEARSQTVALDGGKPRYFFQSSSLFGYEHYGQDTPRLDLGYSIGALFEDGEIRIWPRAVPREAKELRFDVDVSFAGRAADGSFQLRPPQRTRPSVPRPVAVAAAVPGPDDIDRYKRWAKHKHAHVKLLGIGAAELEFQLHDVYVELGIEVQRPRLFEDDGVRDRKGTALHEGPTDDISIQQAFAAAGDRRALFLLGQPGAGKTTSLRKLLQLAIDGGSEVIGLPQGKVPVLAALRHLRPEDLRADQPLRMLLHRELTERGRQKTALADHLWDRGNLVLLLDGLDEIADDGLRQDVLQMITESLPDLRAGGSRCAVSSRPQGLTQAMTVGSEYLQMVVRPLDKARRATMIRQWFGATCRQLTLGVKNTAEAEHEAEREAEDKANELIANIEDSATLPYQLRELVATPLLLNLLCIVVMRGHRIPERRSEFYRACLEVLLDYRNREKESRPPLTTVQALTVLQAVAYQLHTQQRRDDMTFADFTAWSMPILDRFNARASKPVSPRQLLRWLRQRVGLVLEYAQDRYGFAHLGIQEYLAARSIGEQRGDALVQLAGQIGDKWWREVTLLLLGEAPHDEVFVPFVKALLQVPQWHRHHDWLSLCMAEAINGSSAPFLDTLRDEEADPRARSLILQLFKDRRDEAVADAAQTMLGETGLDEALADLVQQTLVLAGRRVTEQAPKVDKEVAALEEAQSEEVQGEPAEREASRSKSAVAGMPPRAAAPAPAGPPPPAALVIEQGPESGFDFHVFMSHSGHDKPAVRRLVNQLRSAGLRPWMDEDELVPGEQWMPALERGLQASAVVLVAVGPTGLGQWQQQEMYVALGMAVRMGKRVVPVFLPELPPGEVSLPLLLQGHMWIDLRQDAERGLRRLIDSLRPEALREHAEVWLETARGVD